MGWMFQYGKPHDERQRILDLLTPSDPSQVQYEALHLVKRGSVWYGAIKTSWPDKPPVVWALIVKTQISRGDWGYKDMDENMGPYHYDAPLKLLDMLSPTDNAYALEWRAKCRIRAAIPRKKEGQIYTSAQPVKFTNGTVSSRFEKVSGRGRYKTLDTPYPITVRMTGIRLEPEHAA